MAATANTADAPVRLLRPRGNAIPLVLDSPHSGTRYPADFRTMQPLHALRTAEDTHVDALFSHAPAFGATLVCAGFPRCYIDCNRLPSDIDQSLLLAPWPGPISVSEKHVSATGSSGGGSTMAATSTTGNSACRRSRRA